MRYVSPVLVAGLIVSFLSGCSDLKQKTSSNPWPVDKANQWYEETGWLIGANFIPSTAINQLEMWQEATFDPETIDRELEWASELGFNSMRVYLHGLLWKQDREGFLRRMEKFLEIAGKHGIRIMFVLLDGVWDPDPQLGRQPEPVPHVHNSGWVQSPGAEVLSDTTQWNRLENYVKGVVRHFAHDGRVVIWDIFNEPDNTNASSYGEEELDNKGEQALKLLKKAYGWVREVNPDQPITSGVWYGSWADPDSLNDMQHFMLTQSDVISFHSYDGPETARKRVEELKQYGRPVFCTEYMARPRGSTFESILPIFKKNRIGAYNWGFVSGKSQTIYPWNSWGDSTYTAEPDLWFHDILRKDGTPYNSSEVQLIQRLTSR